MSDKSVKVSRESSSNGSLQSKKPESNNGFLRINHPSRVRRRTRLANNRTNSDLLKVLKSPNETSLSLPFSSVLENIGSQKQFQEREKKKKSNVPLKKKDEDLVQKTKTFKNVSVTSSLSENFKRNVQSQISNLKITKVSIKESKKIRVLATLLPDEILEDPVTRNLRPYSFAVMFPDISGFTQLCQKYDKTGKGGPSRLTQVLNGYIGSMIQIVLGRNGDVYKFGGDAFLCVWKETKGQKLREIVNLAIESAVDIQKNCGEHETDVGVKLGVKIAVSAGKGIFSIIGTESRKNFVIAGPPVLDIREGERLCQTGDVIVAPAAWKYVENYMLYSYTYHSDNVHVKVHDFGPLWKSARAEKGDFKDTPLEDLRNSLKYLQFNIEDIRGFILPPIMKSIDLNMSLDHLTEMRQVAIVFFNVAIDLYNTPSEKLIEISNEAFNIVCGIVDKTDGAVNKLTLFDKDIAILVVFGLKGFQYELSSQVALKCAYNCLEELKELNVNSASAGVTTGMAYCGVIGHKLRKEYTVMGHPVNMAARLMCTYENIVSSDRETFLHSRLESDYFELLEKKSMKGIQNPGPFYKFSMSRKKNKFNFYSEERPILGRAKEIREFEKFLSSASKTDYTTNFMVIYGDARIGKSRLVAKLINVAQSHDRAASKISHSLDPNRQLFNIFSVLLSEEDSKNSYSTFRLLFQSALGLSESSSMEERENKIRSKFEDLRDVHLLAALNPIFNINFDLLPHYLALSQSEQDEAQKLMVQNLYLKCFGRDTRWLIVIDDAEYIDEDSWISLKWCADQSYSVLYLLTIGQQKFLPNTAKDCLESINHKKIILGGIDKWYYAALACQILRVKGIPVELLNLLQEYKSSGNPGWLESFLFSLLQSGQIYISNVTYTSVKDLKLVCPPEEMLYYQTIKRPSKDDTSHWLNYVEAFEQSSHSNLNNIQVCLLGSNFSPNNEFEQELTMDTVFMKTVDALSPLEQLILKAGSVLGYNFKRTALIYVISEEIRVGTRQLAKAVKKLFEIKILACAKGDTKDLNLLVPRRMILANSRSGEINCECKGVKISKDCKDLPLYASCSFMQFRSPVFRDTISNLLLDDQKKKYHNSCIEFLRKNTYKCKSCNNELFQNLFGEEVDNKVELRCTTSPMHGVRCTKLDPTCDFTCYSKTYSVYSKIMTCPCLKRHLVERVANSQNVESELNVIPRSNCECFQILSAVYTALLDHAAGCGRKDYSLELMLELAAVSLTFFEIPMATQMLDDALALVNQMKEEKEYPDLCCPYIYSKIYAMMGSSKLSVGRPDTCLELLEISLSFLNQDLPRDSKTIKFLLKKEHARHLLITEIHPKNYIGTLPDKKAPFSDLLSECMGLVSTASIYKENWMMAKYAALLSLNEALKSNRNFFGLCSAYTNMIRIAYHEKDHRTTAKLELSAMDVCKRCKQGIIEVFELEAVCQLFKVIFLARHIRAEIEDAISMGFNSIKISTKIRNTSLRLELMPDLVFALIQMSRISEAASLLQELRFTSFLDSDKSSRTWYYALCLDFLLDTGFSILSFETCQKFVKEEEENVVVVRDPNGKYRLYTSLWVWCLRNNEGELSKPFAKALRNFNILDATETPSSVLTRLKRLEGFLITLVHKINTRNSYSIRSTHEEIQKLIIKLEKDTTAVTLLRPRFLLMKTYYKQIKYRDNSYTTKLKQALTMAQKIKDNNTAAWIVHLQMVWSNTISPFQRDHWVQHCRSNLIDWHESDNLAKLDMVMYSLPLPN